jgi:V/A-type H+-transporting ATPase subunit C
VAADFGYVNARVRGMRSRLLSEGFFSDQLAADGFAALAGALAQSPYARELEDARAEFGPLAAVDTALARNYVQTTETLLAAASGTARQLIELLLRRHDLANLKAVVRGLHAGRTADAVLAAVLPAGSLRAGTLRAMAGAADLPAAGQVLALTKHPLAEAFRKGAARHQADRDLLSFEVALDQAFYRRWSHDAQALPAPVGFKRLVALELDAANLRTALKRRGGEGDHRRYYLEGGRDLSLALFEASAASDRSAPLANLTGALAPLSGCAVAEVEGRLVEILDRTARRLTLDPLDVGLVTDYLRRKERETAQLRLLARGKYYGVPRADLERELGHA